MPVKYKAIQMSRPGIKGGGNYKYYPRVYDRKKISMKELAKQIAKSCTLHEADIYATLIALVDKIPELLMNNFSVNMGELGIFSLHINGEASDTPEDVTTQKIIDLKMAFRPSKEIKEKFKEAKFTRRKS